MSRKHAKRESSESLRRFFNILLIIAGALLFLSLAYFLPKLNGPKTTDETVVAASINIPPEMMDLLAQSERLERIYRAAIEVRQPTPEDLQTLNTAIDRLQTYLQNTPNQPDVNNRMRGLQTLRQDALAKPLFDESREAEAESVTLEQRDDYVNARAKVRKSIDLQVRVNTEFPLSQYSNVNRVSQLERMMQVLIARPILDESHACERAAKASMEKQDWSEALKNYRRAVDLQKQLNVSYVQLRFADVGRTQKLEAEISSLESVGLFEKINELSKKGDEALASGDVRQAAEYFQNAYYTQQELNRTYAQSRFADVKRLESLQQKMQTAQSTPLAEEIRKSAEAVRVALRQRDCKQAAFLLDALQPKILSFKESFPLSGLINDELIFEVQFLHVKRDDLHRLQTRVYDSLKPLSSGVMLTQTEVPQALFSEIAGANPSRNRGNDLPVETVNYAEALDFCKRVQFLLAKPVRLPTEKEFREALGALRYTNLDALSWNAENADGKTHPVGTKQADSAGFYDLLGNVGEWILATDDAKNALVMGGNVLTPVDRIGDVPAVLFAKGERNRLNGFRFAVESEAPQKAPETTKP